MSPVPRIAAVVFLMPLLTVRGDPPAWWQEGESAVIDSTAGTNNMGPANIGQAKWMAARALTTLTTLVDPVLAEQVRQEWIRPQPLPSDPSTFLPAIVDFAIPEVLPADWSARQHAALLIGQLKALAAPLYAALHQDFPAWLDQESSATGRPGQLQHNGTKDPRDPSQFYPWSSDPADDSNQAVATIGQLKAVFALHLEALSATLDSDRDGLSNKDETLLHGTDPFNPDSDGDGLGDGWAVAHGLNPNNVNGANDGMADIDGDGLSNSQEILLGTSPTESDNPGIAQEAILNGGFSYPRIGSGLMANDPMEKNWDCWAGLPDGSGWVAVTGSNIELQAVDPITPGNPYVELKANPEGHYGIKQQVGTRSGVAYLLALDCKPRLKTLAMNNNFSVSIDGIIVKTITFATLGPWTHQQLFFIATQAITEIALVPANNPNDTHGCLIDNVTLTPIELTVDANRDGFITFNGMDQTTASKPYRFWVNNDQDDVEIDEPIIVNVNNRDFADYRIKTHRDLEDFSRLAVNAGLDNATLKKGEYMVGIKFKNPTPGGGRIQAWINQSDSGNRDYLFYESAAAQQVKNSPLSQTGDGVIYIPQSYWDSHDGSVAHLIFEGARSGVCELVVTLQTQTGYEIAASSSTWIRLLCVKEMYQRARISNEAEDIENPRGNPTPYIQTWTWDPNGYIYVKDPEATAITAIFVHGWRLKYFDYVNWADTSYKRLWHQGFKGEFYAFRWPTFSGDNNGLPYGYDEWTETSTFPFDTHFPPGGTTYNASEYRAWISGPALASFVNQLPNPLNRNLCVHSMGNVIAGSALRAGMTVKNYALCNAAMAAMAYDPAITHPDCLGYKTPDTDPDPSIRGAYGLASKFRLARMPITFNFGLPQDECLGSWSANNKYFKPNLPYLYTENPILRPFQLVYYDISCNGFREIIRLSEAMGFVTQSRSRAAGAELGTQGSIGVNNTIDMSKWFYKTHSAQWRWNYQTTYPFWEKLVEVLNLNKSTP